MARCALATLAGRIRGRGGGFPKFKNGMGAMSSRPQTGQSGSAWRAILGNTLMQTLELGLLCMACV